MEIEVDVLAGDKQAKFMNEFMHCADVFEKGKQFAIHERLMITGSDSVDITKLCERIANSFEKAGGYAVFVGIRKINNKCVDNSYSWFMKDVQSISMNQEKLRWVLFKNILKQLNYKAQIDECMRVISIQ